MSSNLIRSGSFKKTVYIRATSVGQATAYKQVNVKYVSNSSPTVSGDLSNTITVYEDEDNSGKTETFKIEFKDQDKVTKYTLSNAKAQFEKIGKISEGK